MRGTRSREISTPRSPRATMTPSVTSRMVSMLNFAISPDVRSQDALGLVTSVMGNPAGEQLAWDFIRQRWAEIEKAGGPFASAQVVGATSVFCDAGMRDQVTEFFYAHKVAAAERTYKQSIERINNCVDLKSQQETQ